MSTKKTTEEISFYITMSRYFLFMFEQEFNFFKGDIRNQNFLRANKMIIEKIRQFDRELIVNNQTIGMFSQFKEEKINAIHNVLAMMLNMEESEALEVETMIEEYYKEKGYQFGKIE